jgi:hypothetical protein
VIHGRGGGVRDFRAADEASVNKLLQKQSLDRSVRETQSEIERQREACLEEGREEQEGGIQK